MSLKSIWRRSEDRRMPPGTAVKRYRIAPQHPTYRFVRQQGVLVTKVSGLPDMPLYFSGIYRGMWPHGSSAPRRETALLLRDCRAESDAICQKIRSNDDHPLDKASAALRDVTQRLRHRT